MAATFCLFSLFLLLSTQQVHLFPSESIKEVKEHDKDNAMMEEGPFWEELFADVSSGLPSPTGEIFRSAGNEFFLGFLQGYDPAYTDLQLLVSTAETGSVSFTVESATGDFSETKTVSSSVVTEVAIPWGEYVIAITETGITEKGIRVKAETGKLITVHGTVEGPGQGEAYLAFPCNQIQDVDEYEYYAMTYSGGVFDSAVILVGCEDNTTVTINDTATITLDQFQTYLHTEGSAQSDLTGTRYLSNKPISVFSGNPCTRVLPNQGSCDPLIEQIPPTATWGSSFLSSSFEATAGELYRVLAAYPSTTVDVTCNSMSTELDLSTAGSWGEFLTDPDTHCSIVANNPVFVMEFMLGPIAEDNNNCDPFMTMLPPVDQYSNNYSLMIISGYHDMYITVYVEPSFFRPENIFLDSSTLEEDLWITVDCLDGTACGYITNISVSFGDHQLYHEGAGAKIGVSVHEIRPSTSIGYIGGVESSSSEGKLSTEEELYSGEAVTLQTTTQHRWLSCAGNIPCHTTSSVPGLSYTEEEEVFELYRVFGPGTVKAGDFVGFHYPNENGKWLGCANWECAKSSCPGNPSPQSGFDDTTKWRRCYGEVFQVFARGKAVGEAVNDGDDITLLYVHGKDWLSHQEGIAHRYTGCLGAEQPPADASYNRCSGETFKIWKM